MVIDYQILAKGPMPAPKLIPASASQPAPTAPAAAPVSAPVTETASPQEASALRDAQEVPSHMAADSGKPQLSTDELLNRKMDELRAVREANKLKDSEIAMLKKETTWMKKELRQRTEEVKALKASKAAIRLTPKKKSAEAYPTR